MSTWLYRGLRIGDRVLVSGPYGTFVADPGADGPVLCLAAGSGLAPIRALAGVAATDDSPPAGNVGVTGGRSVGAHVADEPMSAHDS